MKDYCRSHETCLRKLILEYLGFPIVSQERCCCVCDRTCNNAINNSPKVTRKVRTLPTDNKTVLEELNFSELNEFETPTDFTGATLFSFTCEKNLIQKIMEGIEFIETESDLLDTCGIWDETCSSKIFFFITKYAPLVELGNTSDK